MPGSKHSEAVIVGALKQLGAGRKVAEIAREVGVSTYTIYAWKSKYGGMDVSEAQEARQLREENARLKKLVANLIHLNGLHVAFERPTIGPASAIRQRAASADVVGFLFFSVAGAEDKRPCLTSSAAR